MCEGSVGHISTGSTREATVSLNVLSIGNSHPLSCDSSVGLYQSKDTLILTGYKKILVIEASTQILRSAGAGYIPATDLSHSIENAMFSTYQLSQKRLQLVIIV